MKMKMSETLKKYKNYFDVVFDAAGKPQTFLNSLSMKIARETWWTC